MKLYGFSEKSRVNAMMRTLKGQSVFSPGNILNEVKSEWALGFAGPDYRRLNEVSMIDLYFRAISEEKTIRSLSVLVGVFQSKFELNQEKLEALIQETLPYLNPNIAYAQLRWHDVVVLLLMKQLFQEGSEPHRFAAQHLATLVAINEGILKYYEYFSANSWR